MLFNTYFATMVASFLALAATSFVSADNGRHFDIDHATKAFEKAMHNKGDLSLVHYVEGFKELRKFLTNIGALFKFSDSDIEAKISNLEHLMKNPSQNAAACSAYSSIRSAIEFEVEKGLVHDFRRPAVARILSRLQWALEFLSALMLELAKLPYNEDTSYVAREIYDQTLGKHHSWAAKLVVSLALRTLSHKRSLIESVTGKSNGMNEEVIDLKITKLAYVSNKLWRAVEQIYADNNLTGL